MPSPLRDRREQFAHPDTPEARNWLPQDRASTTRRQYSLLEAARSARWRYKHGFSGATRARESDGPRRRVCCVMMASSASVSPHTDESAIFPILQSGRALLDTY
ncbi:hypothetical protein J3F83DRAFT_755726 [Trichoderma novae-zelandiae]